ncbi:hypothetical protein [Pedobacter sp. SYSU D00535]|uniref:hypothetical protein n=1 Tax=Pedobacter sp. SYSU D00535 TaxID=2810308 RepID=UPI001A973790|nr:hypothetical protein [Pedobacter sp. SYSU D00535]
MLNDQTEIKFFELLNRDLSIKDFKEWIYKNESRLETELTADLYSDLISLDYNHKDSLYELEKKIIPYLDSQKFNIWRTRMLLFKIVNNEIDLVLATRKLRNLYNSTEEELLPIKLGLGYESVLDDLLIPSEYDQWNKEELELKLKKLDYYKMDFLRDAQSALRDLEDK